MSKEGKEKGMVRDLLANFPDCPQCEMALKLVRRGLLDQAQAWIETLNDLQIRGQNELFARTPKNGTTGT